MGMIDQASSLDPVVSINSASITATTTGSAVSTEGCRSLTVIIPVGAVATADASNLVTFTVTESVDDSAYTALDSGDYISVIPNGGSAVWDRIINATSEQNACYSFGIKTTTANVSSIKVVGTETGTTEAIYGAYVIRGNVPLEPVNS